MNFLYQSSDGSDLIWSHPASKNTCTLVLETSAQQVLVERINKLKIINHLSLSYKAGISLTEMNNLVLSSIEPTLVMITHKAISNHSRVHISGSASQTAIQNIAFQRHLCTNTDNPTGFSLGDLRNHQSLLEPILRDHSIFSFSLDAIKKSELNLANYGFPTGLTSEEGCQIARYCGEATNVKIFNLILPEVMSEASWQTASYVVWYFMEGLSLNQRLHPSRSDNFQTFIVQARDQDYSYHFQRSPQGKIWLTSSNGSYISCSPEELEETKNAELPHRLLDLF